ncbi:MAG TPA: Smr/MutS family protein [Thermoanaerobaculia bacterium]|jgi:DNA mismatch repair protein MutS2
MAFAPGDAIHVRAIGKGIVREVRNGGRYLVEVNGRSIVTTADQLTADESARKPRPRKTAPARHASHVYEPSSDTAMSLDLHGLTVDEALEAVGAFLNDALLTGVAEVRIIHGRSGGRLKASLHAHLKRIASIRSYAVDPRNAGVTVVRF